MIVRILQKLLIGSLLFLTASAYADTVVNPFTGRLDITGSGGSGGGSSSLEVFIGPARSSPTASIAFNPSDFIGIVHGTTFYISLNPSSTDFYSPLNPPPASGGTPALPFNSVQWNNAGAFGGSANLTYDDTNKVLTTVGTSSASVVYASSHVFASGIHTGAVMCTQQRDDGVSTAGCFLADIGPIGYVGHMIYMDRTLGTDSKAFGIFADVNNPTSGAASITTAGYFYAANGAVKNVALHGEVETAPGTAKNYGGEFLVIGSNTNAINYGVWSRAAGGGINNQNTAGEFQATGGGAALNVGLLVTASGGSINRALQVQNGDVAFNSGVTDFTISYLTASRMMATDSNKKVVSYDLFNSSQAWTGFQNFSSSVTFAGTVYLSSSVAASGSVGTNGQVLTSGGPGTTPTWTTASAGGTPALPFNSVQFNNAGAFGGSGNFNWSGTSMTVLGEVTHSTLTILVAATVSGNGAANRGALDIYNGNAPAAGTAVLMSFGSNQQADQVIIRDQQPFDLIRYGGNLGGLRIGRVGTNNQIYSDQATTQLINMWNSGALELKTTTSGNGGKQIIFYPQQIEAMRVSNTEGVVVKSSMTVYGGQGLAVKYNLDAGSMTGAGLTTCGDSTHAVSWNAAGDSKFGCQSIAGTGVADGDKGDIAVTASGATWTIDPGVVTNAKMAQMTTKTYKGRTAGTTGDPEDVAVATLKTDLVLVKGDVGLGNVDNTSDATKNTNPVFTGTTLTLANAQDIVINATTGSKIGQAGSKIGFYGVTPVLRPTALTQTYVIAGATHGIVTSTAAPAGGVGIAAGGWSSAANRDLAIVTINAVRADVDNLKRFVNQVVDQLQSEGLLQ